jgi:spore coat polysaccharide biosynthesis protein SpsF
MKTGLMIQARLASKRLPGKALLPLLDKPMLFRLLEQIKKSKNADEICLSTSDDASDDKLEEFAKENKIKISRGPVDDIIGRLVRAADVMGAGVLVRIWGDCPLVCSDMLDHMVEALQSENLDYLSNCTLERTVPGGLDLEIYRTDLLKRMDKQITDIRLREFPFQIINQNKLENIKWRTYKTEQDLSSIHLTVDYKEDLAAVNDIYKKLYTEGKSFQYHELISLLKKEPELLQAFANNERNIEYNNYLKQLKGR